MTQVDGERRLRFDAPLERSLVHRHAADEVFVTDHVALDDGRFAVAARLPSAHRYFHDDPVPSAYVDPMLLLECSRQAGTLVAHRHLGVPSDTAFLIAEWSIALDGEPAHPQPGTGSDELTMVIEVRDPKRRGESLLGATLVTELYLAGRRAASSTVVAGYPSRAGYESFRTRRRSSVAPLSDTMPPRVGGTPADGLRAGRALEENVVLSTVRRAGGRTVADLDVPVAHPVFYDHPLDHVPATALLEAARQAALSAIAPETVEVAGGMTGSWRVSALSARFGRFVELDSPTEVSARVEQDGRSRSVRVLFEQDGATACDCEVTVLEPSAAPVSAAPAGGL
ncbi:ScbA/BarX family gamma-butyrolactone biosynthesis protein [Streptomyces sp. ms115]|uniref:ScbA/BarX family gamma-butyrolactone biosynthesis protein n=1 Tax=Streptomyces sp. ms115 TaxID=1827928 RepID=UPI000BEFC5F9|nr:ScbA/BarX family gamma-butyrolactone biosynthesis protein [Streptomyces sp. ms115]